MSKALVKRVKTPCIGVCSTGIGGEVCRGCKRYIHEIAGWNGYSEDEKGIVVDRLSALLNQVMKARINIVDVKKLQAGLNAYNVRYLPNADPYAWAFDLLKAGASQLENLEAFGCRIKHGFKSRSLVEIRDEIDEDFYALSEAHYTRYFEVKS